MSHAASDWMPFEWPDFWDADEVLVMSNDAALLYLWLLSWQWRDGSVPGDPKVLRRAVPARFAECFDASWPSIEPVMPLCDDGRRRNPRCERDLQAANERVQKAAQSGRRGGLERVARLAKATVQGSPKGRLSNPQALNGSDGIGSERIGSDLTGTEQSTQIPPPAGADKPRTPAKRSSSKPKPAADAAAEPEVVPAGYAETVACYFECFEASTGEKPAFGSREGKAVKALLEKAGGPDRACEAIRSAFSNQWRSTEGRTSLPVIASDFNDLIVAARNRGRPKLTQTELTANEVIAESLERKARAAAGGAA